MQIAQLSRQLTEVTQQHEAVSRLYEAESAVAAQCADMVERTNQSNSQLEERMSEACALQAAAEQHRDAMEQQLQQAQVPPAGTCSTTLAEGQLLGQLRAVQAVITFLLDDDFCLALTLITLMPSFGLLHAHCSCDLRKEHLQATETMLQARFDMRSLESCHHRAGQRLSFRPEAHIIDNSVDCFHRA